MRSSIRYGVCSTYLTKLVSHDSVGGDLGRARVVSLQGVLFSFVRQQYPTCVFVRIDRYQSEMSRKETGGSKVDCTPRENEVDDSMPGVLSFFFCTVLFQTLFARYRVCAFTTEYLDLIRL